MHDTKQTKKVEQVPENVSDARQSSTQTKNTMVDTRPSAVQLRTLITAIGSSPRVIAQRRDADMINSSPRVNTFRAQIALQHNSPVQRIAMENHSSPGEKITESEPMQPLAAPPQPNRTGLPDQLKTGIESLSGMSMDHVAVHYNSNQPAQLNAHAYAQGSDIYLASGQERHLPHEAWHVVQQAQGRVNPTMQMKGNVQVNDDAGLEHEADMMGTRALFAGKQRSPAQLNVAEPIRRHRANRLKISQHRTAVIQAVWARLDANTGRRLQLTDNHDGTYTRTQTGKRYRLVRAGPPLVVTEIRRGEHRVAPARRNNSDADGDAGTRSNSTEQPENSSSQNSAEQRRGLSRDQLISSHDRPDGEERETRRRRIEEPEGGSTQAAEEEREESATHALTEEEFGQIGSASTHRFAQRGARRSLYGDQSEAFLERACWNWALTGSSGAAINPSPLFDMLGDPSHDGGPLSSRSFDDAWRRHLPGPVEGNTPDQHETAVQQREAYERHQAQIQALWDRRRSMNAGRGRGRGNASVSAGTAENVENITNDAVRLSMRMNNLEPAEPGEDTHFSIAMARHPDAGVNWSHWGLEVDNHSFETIPDWGLWHQQEGFNYWANQDSIEDRQVTRVPLRNLTPGHLVGIRGQLNVMRGRGDTRQTGTAARRGSTRGRGRTTRNTQTQQSTSQAGGEAAPVIALAVGQHLNAGGMVMHYFPAIAWANAQGTYSEEFHWVRNNPALAQNLLRHGGMTAGATQVFTQQFAAAIHHSGQQHIEYVLAPIQMQIMNTLGAQEQLFAIIRYLRQLGGQQEQGASSSTTPEGEQQISLSE